MNRTRENRVCTNTKQYGYWTERSEESGRGGEKIQEDVKPGKRLVGPDCFRTSADRSSTAHAYQFLLSVPSLGGTEIGALTSIASEDIAIFGFPMRRGIVAAQGTRGAHFAVGCGKAIGTEQTRWSSLLGSQGIVRNSVVEGIAVVTLQPKGVILIPSLGNH